MDELEKLKQEKILNDRLTHERAVSNKSYAEKRAERILYWLLGLIFVASVSFVISYIIAHLQ